MRMIDMIRQSAVPPALMRAAARGELSLPESESLEILVYLTKHPMFAEQARMTLTAWDEAAALDAANDPDTPAEVLDYLSAPENLRPRLIHALLENPSVPETRLVELARNAPRELLEKMLLSARARMLPGVVRALLDHPQLTCGQVEELKTALLACGESVTDAPGQDLFEPELSRYLREHGDEIAAEQEKPFRLIDWTVEEQTEIAAVTPTPAALAAHTLASERLSPVQKISHMTVGERVQLALKGNRDERFILIRDGAKVVSHAVLESPKLTDSEVELFASMKNVAETVLRGIAGKRKFIKAYAVKRILAANPRCPLDIALPLLKELLVNDLKNLTMNKNISDTVRKMALKIMREKVKARAQ